MGYKIGEVRGQNIGEGHRFVVAMQLGHAMFYSHETVLNHPDYFELMKIFRLREKDVLEGGIADYGNMSEKNKTLCLIWEVDVKRSLGRIYHCFEKPVLERFRQIDPLVKKVESSWNRGSHQIAAKFLSLIHI